MLFRSSFSLWELCTVLSHLRSLKTLGLKDWITNEFDRDKRNQGISGSHAVETMRPNIQGLSLKNVDGEDGSPLSWLTSSHGLYTLKILHISHHDVYRYIIPSSDGTYTLIPYLEPVIPHITKLQFDHYYEYVSVDVSSVLTNAHSLQTLSIISTSEAGPPTIKSTLPSTLRFCTTI